MPWTQTVNTKVLCGSHYANFMYGADRRRDDIGVCHNTETEIQYFNLQSLLEQILIKKTATNKDFLNNLTFYYHCNGNVTSSSQIVIY